MKTIILSAILLACLFTTGCREENIVAPQPALNGAADPQFFFKASLNGSSFELRGGANRYSTQPIADYGPGLSYGFDIDEKIFKTSSLFEYTNLSIIPGYKVFVSFALPNRNDITVKNYAIAWPDLFTNAPKSSGKAAIQIRRIGNDLNSTNLFSYAVDNNNTRDLLKVTAVEDYVFKGQHCKKVSFSFECNVYDVFSLSPDLPPATRLTGSAVMLF
jgi:hypothetical protein